MRFMRNRCCDIRNPLILLKGENHMAKTNDSNIFVVKSSWVERVTASSSDKKKRPVWYLSFFTNVELAKLHKPGNSIHGITKAGRVFVVASVSDITAGTSHQVTLPNGSTKVVQILEKV